MQKKTPASVPRAKQEIRNLKKMSYKFIRQVILAGLVTVQTLMIFQLCYRTYKAEVCNVVFVRYLRDVRGINVNMDRIYEDGRKWISDPRYTDSEHP